MSDQGPLFDMPATYRIVIGGDLPNSWSDRMGGMEIVPPDQACDAPVTVLSGWLSDQAALLGVLNTLYELHFPLVVVEYLELGPENAAHGWLKPS